MKKYSTILFFCLPFFVQAQSAPKQQAVSIEIGKTGLVYNLTYDHRLQNKKYGFQFNVGSNFGRYLQAFTTGAGLYYLTGKRTRFLETGAGLNYIHVIENSDDQKGFAALLIYPNYTTRTYFTNAVLGYRSYTRKTLFRIGAAPGFTKDRFVPGAYLSFGILL